MPDKKLTDKECAKRMKEIIKGAGDEEVRHCAADDLLCEILESFGFVETVKAYDEIPKWYA